MISYTNVIIFKTIAVYQKPVEKILELLPLIEPLELDLHLACLSHNACSLISQSLIVPLLLLYTNRLHSCGWNSAAVITSVSSSMLAGFMSTISHPIKKSPCTRSIKKKLLWLKIHCILLLTQNFSIYCSLIHINTLGEKFYVIKGYWSFGLWPPNAKG